MKRREFLGRVAQAIAGLGLIDAATLRYGVDAAAASRRYPYYQVAPPTGRKLALLVGINQYPSTQPLSGCLTDVELQRELLIHRFGFKASDILTLSEQQATRQQIESAFIEHLTEQVQPGDVVVFHFSGYGRRVQKRAGGSGGEISIQNPLASSLLPLAPSPSPLTPDPSPVAYNSLVTYNGEDLLEETLWLLLRSLSTKNITTILDTSFNSPGKILPGNLQIRSLPQAFDQAIAQAELDFQKQIKQLKVKPYIIPGVVLHATDLTGSATEAKWNGFSAGLFTYALTQYLWSATPPTTVQVSLGRVRSVVEQLVDKQEPQLSGQNQSANLTYNLRPESNIGADGVVKLVEEDGKTAQLWLAGILPTVLEYYEIGSKFTLVPPQAKEQGEVGELGKQGEKNLSPLTPHPSSLLQLRSRSGLIAKAHIIGNSNSSVQVGQLVQEAIRVLPQNIRLSIALDPSLERIERVDATSAFATIPYVSIVTAQDTRVDYVFGRVPEPPETPTTLTTSSPNRYGLFSLDRKLIPNTAVELGEVVKFAVQRLSPKLQTLLAAKLWRLTTNEASSLLNVKATLEIIDGNVQVLMQQETQRKHPCTMSVSSKLVPTPPNRNSISTDTVSIPIGSRIQYRVRNDGDCPVYLLLLGLDSSKNAIAFFSGTKSTVDDTNPKPLVIDVAIAPGETLIIPPATVDSQWVMRKPTGVTEHQLIFSTAKFSQTVAALGIAGQNTEDSQYIGALSNPLEVAQAMMLDLHNASATQGRTTASNTDTVSSTESLYSLDVNHWASLSFVYQLA